VWNWTDEMFAGLASEMPKMVRLDKVFEIPNNCNDCLSAECVKRGWVKQYEWYKRPDDCPLVEVE
jgi:hypothetical protein